MKGITKVCLVILGYVLTYFAACQAVVVHMALTAEDSRGADGMYAFGEGILFLLVFGLVALVPTVAAIYFWKTRKPR